MELKINDTITPRLIIIEAYIMALANAICTEEQFAKFNRGKAKYIKDLVSELVKQNPRLLQESPELKKMLED